MVEETEQIDFFRRRRAAFRRLACSRRVPLEMRECFVHTRPQRRRERLRARVWACPEFYLRARVRSAPSDFEAVTRSMFC